MADLVQRLRDQGKDAFAKQYSLGMFKLCDEAAVEIEQLRERVAEMQAEAGMYHSLYDVLQAKLASTEALLTPAGQKEPANG